MLNKKQINMPVDNAGYTPLFNQQLLIESIKKFAQPALGLNEAGEPDGIRIIPERRDFAELYALAMKLERSSKEMQLNMLKMLTQ